ncbi:MAG TPA: hypothetical protein VFA72_21950 [Burkholderiales bacterium]|nr:hypothetical protein [Burkholderiales bacterium]
MADPRPLFAHPRLIAAAMLIVLTAVTGAALYMRPLSSDTQLAHGQSQAATVAAVLD